MPWPSRFKTSSRTSSSLRPRFISTWAATPSCSRKQAQQNVLGADVVVIEVAGLLHRILDHLLGPRSLRELAHRDHVGSALNELLDLHADFPKVDVEVLEHVGGDPAALLDEAEQDVLGADVLVVEPLGLLVGQLHHFPGTVRETLVHRCSLLNAKPNCSSFIRPPPAASASPPAKTAGGAPSRTPCKPYANPAELFYGGRPTASGSPRQLRKRGQKASLAACRFRPRPAHRPGHPRRTLFRSGSVTEPAAAGSPRAAAATRRPAPPLWRSANGIRRRWPTVCRGLPRLVQSADPPQERAEQQLGLAIGW